MLIHVTEQHIQKGKQGSATQCPIGIAIRESIGEKNDVLVGLTGVFINTVLYHPPTNCAVYLFDGTGFMAPLEFELNISDGVR